MTDRFSNVHPSLSGPASTGFAILPDDDVDLVETTRGLYLGSGGDIAVVMASGASIVLTSVPGGSILPLRVSRVLDTGTTADGIVGLV
ncbi:hypothetical protein NBH19_12905 [Rhizobium sp. S95]|uniref:Uncharacterized protein n=1 Tax=Ciceribacter sichuanensis TaxID=2949647 RepID=A0AAJ1F7H5_9HYPH|nr:MULTISPECIES: hypothetical protein [unclassified Ciceribacter]MCM2396971.1 hypothetical protein [Ciceribacter sp. S95]MCO5957937.1 hypothetical protein [Ciceribacter sp. S101]